VGTVPQEGGLDKEKKKKTRGKFFKGKRGNVPGVKETLGRDRMVVWRGGISKGGKEILKKTAGKEGDTPSFRVLVWMRRIFGDLKENGGRRGGGD